MTSMKKQHIIGIVVVAIAIPVIAMLWVASQQMTAADAHIADCKTHLIALVEAEQRYKQDGGNNINGVLTSLNGIGAQDYQAVRTKYQDTYDNCLDAMSILQNDRQLLGLANKHLQHNDK